MTLPSSPRHPNRIGAAGADRLAALTRTVGAHTGRVAGLGGWGDRAAGDALTSRLPQTTPDGDPIRDGAGGFDAGIGCALDLIPRPRQRLAAQLHAAYQPAAVAQVRAELADLTADSATCWWLAACAVCTEGHVDAATFLAQVDRFSGLARDPEARLAAARAAATDMRSGFEVRDQIAIAVRDGGMQGAYLAGHDLAGQYAAEYGVYFLGTFHASLGLEQFAWAEPGDPTATDPDRRRGRSGPVNGSAQFVKCADAAEFAAAVAAARPHD